jgi:UDP-N-acetylmuramate dehydrogenase
MLLEQNRPLAPLTTLAIGGPARWFVEARSEAQIADAADWARERGSPMFVLGGGSNLLVADEGFDGLVVHVALRGIEIGRDGKTEIYRVAAGEVWDSFVARTIKDGCAGIECLAGIPGTVGGTPVQNVGAYGQEAGTSIECVRALDLRTRTIVELPAAECGFGYRRSRFNSTDRGRYVVTHVDFRLKPGGSPTLRYAELQSAFPQGSNPDLAQVAGAVRRIRRSKGMLLVAGDPDCQSAGSFFKNPVVARQRVEQIASVSGQAPPCFPSGKESKSEEAVKLSAAWLIEQSGFAKGFVRGAAGLSSRHTLAVINRGGAKAWEILELADEIAQAVERRFSIRLEREPELLGFPDRPI